MSRLTSAARAQSAASRSFQAARHRTTSSANIGAKAGGRATVALAHTGLASAEDVVRWRAAWKDLLAAL